MRKLLPIIAIATTCFAAATSCMAADTLTDKQKSVISIAAYTASNRISDLRAELTKGLENGLTVNEINEVLVQLYAYTGFPRSLNGINTFMSVVNDRQKAGINDPKGKGASPVDKNIDKDAYGARVRADLGGRKVIPAPSGYQLFAPAIDTFLKEHLFCDIFIRDVIDPQTRELATIAALSAMEGTAGQMRFHYNGAMNTGTTEPQMTEFVEIIGQKMGEPYVTTSRQVLNTVLEGRKAKK